MKFLALGLVLLTVFLRESTVQACPPGDPKLDTLCDGLCDSSRECNVKVADPCGDCKIFYTCAAAPGSRRGVVTPVPEVCPCGLCFSSDTRVCSDPSGEICPTQEARTESITVVLDVCYRAGTSNDAVGPYVAEFKAAPSTADYLINDNGIWVLMHCAPGTYFVFGDPCACITCPAVMPPGAVCAGAVLPGFCEDFDDQSKLNGIYINGLSSIPLGIGHSGFGGIFDGSKWLEIPYFQNNEFTAFTWLFWLKRDAASLASEQGIVYNGADPDKYPGSITIFSLAGGVNIKGGVITDSPVPPSPYSATSPNADQSAVWHHVAVRYDGSAAVAKLEILYDGVVVASNDAIGTTLRNDCPLVVGKGWNSVGVQEGFVGTLDGICFYRVALTDAQIANIMSST